MLFQSSPDEQEYFISLMTKSQRGRMDEQRCSLNVSPMSTPAHKSGPSTSVRGENTNIFTFICFCKIINLSFCLIFVISYYHFRARSRKVLTRFGQLSEQTTWWPTSGSSFIAGDKKWKYIKICCRERCKLPVLHGLQSPGWFLYIMLSNILDNFTQALFRYVVVFWATNCWNYRNGEISFPSHRDLG